MRDLVAAEFIAAVSHELRTPLTSIIGALELVRDAELPEAERECLDMALRNSERLARLMSDIIDLERIESGALALAAGTFQVADLLREAVHGNRALGAAGGVELAIDELLPQATVRADEGRLAQVMANLLANGVKHSPPGEAVMVRARLAGARVRVEVSDRGAAIGEQFRGRIFEKFAHADSSRPRHRGGFGLGLAICKAIVIRCGGEIGFESRLGGGATFWFELPAGG